MIICDVTNQFSFENIHQYIETIRLNCASIDYKIFILANKIESFNRVITDDQLSALEPNFKCQVRSVSAKTGEGIAEVFQEMLQKNEPLEDVAATSTKDQEVKPNYFATFRERMFERVLYMFIALQILD
jgi:GTPase SAR1 family protein